MANAAPLDPERLIKILAKHRVRFASIDDVNVMYLNCRVGPAEVLEFIASYRSISLSAVTKEQPSKFFNARGAGLRLRIRRGEFKEPDHSLAEPRPK